MNFFPIIENPYLDVILCSLAVFFFMIIALRIFGKRTFPTQHRDFILAMSEIDSNISLISGNETLQQTRHKRKIHKTLENLNN